MNDELFRKLIESVRQGGAILRGKAKPARAFEIAAPDVKRIRAQYQLSQSEFAALLGISVATVRNWAQGRRVPDGPSPHSSASRGQASRRGVGRGTASCASTA